MTCAIPLTQKVSCVDVYMDTGNVTRRELGTKGLEGEEVVFSPVFITHFDHLTAPPNPNSAPANIPLTAPGSKYCVIIHEGWVTQCCVQHQYQNTFVL